MHRWPQVVYNEEVMREGLGIEDVAIPLAAKVELLDALSKTGLKRLTLGAFVSPKFVPQMANFEEMLRAFHPRAGVTYLPYLHNQKARERAEQFSPPLTLEAELFSRVRKSIVLRCSIRTPACAGRQDGQSAIVRDCCR